jgi:probable F420-dependent oxidoreductase
MARCKVSMRSAAVLAKQLVPIADGVPFSPPRSPPLPLRLESHRAFPDGTLLHIYTQASALTSSLLVASHGEETLMELGIALPTSGASASPDTIARIAEVAEGIGLEAVWTYDRLLRPTEPIPMGGPDGPTMEPPPDWAVVYDPLETLTYAAAKTSRIRLGTSVLDPLFQNPVVLARRLATLDQLSHGRLLVGIGQGWMAHEFTATGVPMKRRGAGFEEHLQAMRAVWGPDPVRYSGRFYRIPECEIGPKPVRPDGPQMIVGAASPPALERAARLGLGLTLVMFSWDVLEATINTFRSAAEDAGHDPRSLPIIVQVNGAISTEPTGDERAPLTGSVDQVANDLARLEPLRADHVFWAMAPDPDEQLRGLEHLRARIK